MTKPNATATPSRMQSVKIASAPDLNPQTNVLNYVVSAKIKPRLALLNIPETSRMRKARLANAVRTPRSVPLRLVRVGEAFGRRLISRCVPMADSRIAPIISTAAQTA